MDVLVHGHRSDHVVRALQHNRRRAHPLEIAPVVGKKRRAREGSGDLGVRPAEAVGELLAEFGPVRVAHDHRRHRARPPKVVALKRSQQARDVLLREAADVPLVVEIARRGPDKHQAGEALGARGRGTMRYSSPNAGQTNRHMLWSHPNPWANIIGRPSGRPCTVTLLRSSALTAPRAEAPTCPSSSSTWTTLGCIPSRARSSRLRSADSRSAVFNARTPEESMNRNGGQRHGPPP